MMKITGMSILLEREKGRKRKEKSGIGKADSRKFLLFQIPIANGGSNERRKKLWVTKKVI